MLQDLSLTRANDISVRGGPGSSRNNTIGFNFKSQEQMLQHKAKEETALAKAKKLLA